jgi:hypothetical protein
MARRGTHQHAQTHRKCSNPERYRRGTHQHGACVRIGTKGLDGSARLLLRALPCLQHFALPVSHTCVFWFCVCTTFALCTPPAACAATWPYPELPTCVCVCARAHARSCVRERASGRSLSSSKIPAAATRQKRRQRQDLVFLGSRAVG